MPAYEDQLQAAFDPEAFRVEGKRVVDILADHLAASNPDGRPKVLAYEDPEAMLASWADRFGRTPSKPFPELLPEILARSNDLLHPRFVGHQCTTALPLAALAGFAGQFLNNGTAVYEMGPVNTAMERHLVRWMAGLAGWGPDADGVLTSGGSIGNLTALLAARQWAAESDVWRDGVGDDRGAVLVSEQCHYSVRRAVAVMGLGENAAVPVAVDERFHMTAAGLEKAWSEADRRGRRPFAVVANGCSTATGSYDDLTMVGEFAARRGLWFHVDGAHGAGALLTEKYRHLLKGLERADSFIWDAHKNMLMPALITAVLFRDGRRSYEAFSQKASYLFERDAREEWFNFAHRTLECTKTMMGMRLFVSLAAYGTDFFAGYVTAMWDLARAFAAQLRRAGDFEVAVEPESNIVCFRHLRPDEKDASALQRRIRRALLERGTFYVVQTELAGNLWLRCTLINPRTTAADLGALIDEIRSLA
ncbi:MAG: aminotransferase class I/II-fold pyridoxal phosphate-dependent enzyme [Candidatus Aminicenantes bacterium]|nr:aminotransferase class I/II-fold pyridoxal phosphate-dependent enzyme [Candidatus Aminicenantes bacterium]